MRRHHYSISDISKVNREYGSYGSGRKVVFCTHIDGKARFAGTRALRARSHLKNECRWMYITSVDFASVERSFNDNYSARN